MKRFTSSIAVLQHLVKKRKVFDELSSKSPDRRELFEIISNYLEMDELTLMCTIGDYMNIPVLKKYTKQFSQYATSEISITEQERNAFALLSSQSGAGAVACLEPAWLEQYPHQQLNGPFLLCGWKILRDYYHYHADKKDSLIKVPNSRITDQISLDNILRRLAFLGVNEAVIEFSDTDVKYEVIAPDLITYRGVLYPVSAQEIEQELYTTAENSPHQIYKEISGASISITVHKSNLLRSFRLTWTPLPGTLQIHDELNELLH